VTIKDSVSEESSKYSVGGSAQLAGYLKAHGRDDDHVLVINGGDDFQGTPISSITSGWSQVELMNLLNPDAMVLGNHEFDYGTDTLRHYLRRMEFPILAANLFDSTTGRTFAPPYVVRKAGVLRIGIIGLLPPDLEILTLKGNLRKMAVLNTDSVLNVYIPQLKADEKVDLIVIASHMGVEQDTALAARRNDIDIIVGGHSHTALFEPLKKNRTIVVQAGTRGRYLGELRLNVDVVGDSVLSYSGRLIETRNGVHSPDPAIAATVDRFEKLVDTELSAVIGTLAASWTRSWSSESNIGNWVADAFRAYAGTDIAFMNSGGLRKDVEAGQITKRDIWELSPFGNTLVTFSVRGDSLWRMMEWQAARKGELMQVSGMAYTFDPEQPFGQMLRSVRVGGNEIDPTRSYTIVTNKFVGGHLPTLFGPDGSGPTLNDLNIVDRDVLIEALLRTPVVSSKVEGRIKNVRAQENTETRQ